MKDWAPISLRLILGFSFGYHGCPKIFSSEEREGFVGMLQMIGVPLPEVMAWAVGLLEFLGGIGLILGLFVQIVGVLLTLDMLVAMFTVHLPQGFNFMQITGMTDAGPTFGMPGYEVHLLYLAGLAALILGGAGACSLDRVLRSPRSQHE